MARLYVCFYEKFFKNRLQIKNNCNFVCEKVAWKPLLY